MSHPSIAVAGWAARFFDHCSLACGRGFHAMVAGIDATNTASLKLHAKFGFEQVAHFREVGWKFERWLDLVFLERIF